MKILVLTQGTRGDVQPFVALANVLSLRGHQVVLGAPSGLESEVISRRIVVVSLPDVTTELINDLSVRRAFETNYQGIAGKILIPAVLRRYHSVLNKIMDQISVFRDSAADLVVHHATVPGHEIAEKIGAQAVPVCLTPSYMPTKTFADPMLPFSLPMTMNTTSHRLSRLWLRLLVGNTTRWRRDVLRLPYRWGHRDPFRRPDGQPATVLHAYSRILLPTNTVYPHWIRPTGFWFWKHSNSWSPPRDLHTFLNAGDSPVYIGFGSVSSADPDWRRRLIDKAIELAEVRAIVAEAVGQIDSGMHSENVFYIGSAPFGWLFPRMAAIVHHGGSGTTGWALASGRPQVVCPAVYGQPFNAFRMYRIGVAVRPKWQRDLTAESLARSIRAAVTDSKLSLRSGEIAKEIEAEDGVDNAAAFLESL